MVQDAPAWYQRLGRIMAEQEQFAIETGAVSLADLFSDEDASADAAG